MIPPAAAPQKWKLPAAATCLNAKMTSSIPSDFVCPLTLLPFTTPVNVCVNGHIFDLDAINEWFHGDRDMSRPGNDSCPTCRTKLGSFRPERELKKRVQEWLAANPGGYTVSAPPSPLAASTSFRDGKVTLSATTFNYGPHAFVNIVATTDPTSVRQGGLYILGLDYSGSMSELVDKDAKEVFYTRMDLAKYTIECVARMLEPQDSLALVAFSTDARVAMEPTHMDDAGRRKLAQLLSNINPDASTNIDAAITTMMSVANRPEMAGRAIFGALLTDGAETVIPHPTTGTVKWLSKQEMKNPWVLSTFGFGYELDSMLLTRLAEMPSSGSGTFGFIPDLSMIAKVFINWAANCLVTGTRDAVIQCTVNGKTGTFNTGALAVGQPRNFLVEIPHAAAVKVSLDGQEITPTQSAPDMYAMAWNNMVTTLEQVSANMNMGQDIKSVLDILDQLYLRFRDETDPRVQGLMRDVRSADPSEGQVGMAPRYWGRWGAHYTRSYRRAQQIQRRLNSDDPGSLIYGGRAFEDLCAEGERLFLTMDPPAPTGRGGAVQTTVAQRTAYLTQAWSGGCFAGDTLVLMGNGQRMPIKSLLPGDRIWTPSGVVGLNAVVTMGHSSAKSLMMCAVKGVIITPYHPYLNEKGEWTTGSETVPVFEWNELGLKLYNLVLEAGHIIDVGGVQACTLAHGFKGPVIEHPFFGTEAVVECLERAKGWERRMPYYNDLQVVHKDGMVAWWYENGE